jgi:hypothetical protein
MNVGIGTEAAQFLLGENISWIFGTVYRDISQAKWLASKSMMGNCV